MILLEIPAGVITVTWSGPCALFAGEVVKMASSTAMKLEEIVPNSKRVAPPNLDPVSVTASPPVIFPEEGEMFVIFGPLIFNTCSYFYI